MKSNNCTGFGVRTGAVFFFGWLYIGTAGAQSISGPWLMARRYRVRLAHQQAMEAVTTDPSPDNHAVYAAVLARSGFYADAVEQFKWALGSSWYESRGIDQHAKALSKLGRHHEAIQLRLENFVASNESLPALHDSAEDYIALGLVHEAEDLLFQAMAINPTTVRTHLLMAELARLRGDDPGFHLWLASRSPAGSSAGRWAAAWEKLRLGELSDSELRPLRAGQLHNPEATRLRLSLMRNNGDQAEAISIVEGNQFSFHDDPDLHTIIAHLYIDENRTTEAEALLVDARSRYPDHSGLSEALGRIPR